MRDKSQLSGLTVPVGGGKGKKNWEQLQQESTEGGAEPRTEGVQVGTVCSSKSQSSTSREKKFYHHFSIVKYSYLPKDTFKKLC